MSFIKDLFGGKSVGQVIGGALGGALNTGSSTNPIQYPNGTGSNTPAVDLNKYVQLPTVNVAADQSQLKTILIILAVVITGGIALFAFKSDKKR